MTHDNQLGELEFLRRDQARMQRVMEEAQSEVQALRRLVGDFIADVYPHLSKVEHCDPESWQHRCQRVIAGCSVRLEGGVTPYAEKSE